MDLQTLLDDIDEPEIEKQLEAELRKDLNPFPGLAGKTYADLGMDFTLGTLTLQNSLSRMVWLHSIDSPFVQPRDEDLEITGADAAECAYILAFGPARLDHLMRWQMAHRLYPGNLELALRHRAAFCAEACEWFESIMENNDDLQDLTNSLVQIILASMRASDPGTKPDLVLKKKRVIFNAYWAYEKAFAVVEITQGAYSLDYVLDYMPLAQTFAILDFYAIYRGERNPPPDPYQARENSIRLKIVSEMLKEKLLNA